MATTENGTYYPSDYSLVADVPGDMKKMAESIDANKVQKIPGKRLSTNDFTDEYKEKLDDLENYDDTEIKQDIEDLQEEQGTSNADITSLKNRVSTLETDNAQNKSDISTLKSDNQTNKTNISTMQGQISNIQQEQQTQNSNIKNNTDKNTEQDELISKLQEDNQKFKNALINAETEQSKSIHIEDASTIPAQLEILGNQEQETRSGKNKLNLENIKQTTRNGITRTYNEDGSVTFNGTCTVNNTGFAVYNANINCVKNQTTMSVFYINGSVSAQEEKTAYISARISSSDYSKTLSFSIVDLNNSNTVISNQYKSDDSLLEVFSFRIDEGTILNNFTVKVMITNTPEEATEYEKYGVMPSTNYPSPVIGLGSNLDGTFKGSTEIKISNENEIEEISKVLNIQQEMLNGDYFELEEDGWKEVHGWAKKVFDGTEGWRMPATNEENAVFCNLSYTTIYDYASDADEQLSTHFVWGGRVGGYQASLGRGVGIYTYISGEYSYVYFVVPLTVASTVEEWKAWLAEQAEAGTPLTNYYKSTTPAKLTCTEAQSVALEELSNLYLFDGTNNIITAEDIALLKLKYVVDTKTYIDNKLNTINQQILEIIGGNE